ncbi:MAG TPA: inner membrane CreD family protein [Candidatus Acidoferrales bacterium]
MIIRIAAIVFILLCTSVAWGILGTTIFHRTYDTDARLRDQVVSIWGAPHEQTPPTAAYQKTVTSNVESVEDGKKIVRTVKQDVAVPLPLEGSRINVALDLEHRQKGLLWYSTYKVDFGGVYTFRNTSAQEEVVVLTLNFPATRALYDDIVFVVDGQPQDIQNHNTGVTAAVRVPSGKTTELKVGYRSQGLESWRYNFGADVARVRDFHLGMTTNFKDIDFPENTLSPSEKQATADGWKLDWTYKNLLSGFQIGMQMPGKLQPGPLAGQISYFAPVSLLFFFFILFILTTLRSIELHPMNYFFLAGAFFSFHLLLAYLVDHISIHAAFVICSLVSIFLVVSYLRLAVGMRFAAVEAAAAQFLYLVLFSYAFFFEGYTGLTVTIGAILTLFVIMQLTGRIRWSEKFARPAAAPLAAGAVPGTARQP